MAVAVAAAAATFLRRTCVRRWLLCGGGAHFARAPHSAAVRYGGGAVCQHSFAGRRRSRSLVAMAAASVTPAARRRASRRCRGGRSGGRWGGGYWHGGYWPGVFWGGSFAWFLPVLPAFCATYWWNSVPYYYYNDVYYTYDPSASGYVVTTPPPALIPVPRLAMARVPAPAAAPGCTCYRASAAHRRAGQPMAMDCSPTRRTARADAAADAPIAAECAPVGRCADRSDCIGHAHGLSACDDRLPAGTRLQRQLKRERQLIVSHAVGRSAARIPCAKPS